MNNIYTAKTNYLYNIFFLISVLVVVRHGAVHLPAPPRHRILNHAPHQGGRLPHGRRRLEVRQPGRQDPLQRPAHRGPAQAHLHGHSNGLNLAEGVSDPGVEPVLGAGPDDPGADGVRPDHGAVHPADLRRLSQRHKGGLQAHPGGALPQQTTPETQAQTVRLHRDHHQQLIGSILVRFKVNEQLGERIRRVS